MSHTGLALPADSRQRGPYAARVHACAECGQASDDRGTFCGDGCRHAFHNRRKARGADLYDLYMAFRYDRTVARALNVLTAINRLVAQWRHEDQVLRSGRQSWTAPGLVIERHPFLRARVLDRGRS